MRVMTDEFTTIVEAYYKNNRVFVRVSDEGVWLRINGEVIFRYPQAECRGQCPTCGKCLDPIGPSPYDTRHIPGL